MTLCAGVIGLGRMGSRHARALRELEGVKLIGAADPLGDRWGAAPDTTIVASVSDLLELKPDYCVVATPTSTHTAVSIQLARAGVAALVEKPLATTAVDAAMIIAAFADTATAAAVGHIERHNPAIAAMRALVRAGTIGDIHQLATRRLGGHPQHADTGAILDLAIHDIDIVSYLTGLPIRAVTARSIQPEGHRHEDAVTALSELDSGITASHVVNRMSPVCERLIVVMGAQGSLIANTIDTTLTCQRGHEEIACALELKDPLTAEHEAFRDMVLGHPAIVASLAEAAAAVSAAEAMQTSARLRITVELAR